MSSESQREPTRSAGGASPAPGQRPPPAEGRNGHRGEVPRAEDPAADGDGGDLDQAGEPHANGHARRAAGDQPGVERESEVHRELGGALSAPPPPAEARTARVASAPREHSGNGGTRLTTRVALCDAFPVLRRGLHALLARERDIDVVAASSDVHAMLALAREQRPDVLVVEFCLDDPAHAGLVREVSGSCEGTAVLAVGLVDDTETMVAAMVAGARGYLTIHDPLDGFVDAVREVAAGHRALSAERAVALARFRGRSRRRRTWRDLVSRQELELLRCFARCMTVQQAARHLDIAPSTVSTYRQRLLNKLELPNTAHLIRFAIEHRVDDEPSGN